MSSVKLGNGVSRKLRWKELHDFQNMAPVPPQAELRRPARPAICFSCPTLTGAASFPAGARHVEECAASLED